MMTEPEAGRALDARIATRVMGWIYDYTEGADLHWKAPQADQFGVQYFPLPAYSTDMAAAWQVVERLAALGWEPSVTRWVQQPGVTPHTSCYLERNEPETGILLETYEATADAHAPALAICRAALGVVEAE